MFCCVVCFLSVENPLPNILKNTTPNIEHALYKIVQSSYTIVEQMKYAHEKKKKTNKPGQTSTLGIARKYTLVKLHNCGENEIHEWKKKN